MVIKLVMTLVFTVVTVRTHQRDRPYSHSFRLSPTALSEQHEILREFNYVSSSHGGRLSRLMFPLSHICPGERSTPT